MLEELSIRRFGSETSHALAKNLSDALASALALQSKVSAQVLVMPGMSGRKYRRFVNNLVSNVPAPSYLEIGSFLGSTACAAMCENTAKVTCIDNWSQFGGPKDAFIANTNECKSNKIDFSFVESDFRAIDYNSIGTFNIYMFDGPHSYQDQYDGVRIVQPALAREHILIVDDYNWPDVRSATQSALADENAEIMFGYEIRTTQDDTHPTRDKMELSDWHNGYFFAVIRKSYS